MDDRIPLARCVNIGHSAVESVATGSLIGLSIVVAVAVAILVAWRFNARAL